jgi:hypothetical protein
MQLFSAPESATGDNKMASFCMKVKEKKKKTTNQINIQQQFSFRMDSRMD